MVGETPSNKPYLPVEPADRDAVADAFYRFAAGQDERDDALLASAFAEDATLDFRQPASRLGMQIPVFAGRDTIEKTIMSSTASLDTTHTITNLRIMPLEPDMVQAHALIEAQHLVREDHGRNLLLKNIITAKLRRDGTSWVFVDMVFKNVWREGEPSVLFPGIAAAA